MEHDPWRPVHTPAASTLPAVPDASGRRRGATPSGGGPRRIANRYDLIEVIGRGGHGVVWRAHDLVSRTAVALKWTMHAAVDAARYRREVATLRALRVPGVVRMLDEGDDDGFPFLVMDLVEGDPFPGVAKPCAWGAIEAPTIALLETLSRIHAAGIVHRDLKPGNVLVDGARRPTVLDFGISHEAILGDRLTIDGSLVGTPAYLAPEQILGQPATPRVDLYALGVMLFEALAARPPFDASTTMSLLAARVWRAAAPLRSVAPEVPERVARLVDALLATSPDDRPSTATEALALLRDGARLASGPELPRLGGDDPVRSVVEAALSGRSVDVVGPRGAGATRLLADVEAALAAAGRPVRRTVVDRQPLASLAGALGAPSVAPGASFTDATSAVEQRLREVLEQGAVVLVDDADRIDAPSAAVIDHARALGAVVRVRPGAPASAACVALHALSPASLATLFRGPERIAHLPSDAAQALWARTDGLPARVAEELEAWLRAGIARRDGASFVVDREGLDLLASGMPLTQRAPPAATSSTSPTLLTLPPELDELLGYIVLAWPNTSLAVLAAVSGAASWRIDAGAEELARHGFVRRLPDGRFLPLCALTPHDRLSDGARRRVHAAIAASIAPATSGRLLHLMSSEAEEGERAIDVVAEACAVARAMASAGKAGHALAVLDATASYLRRATVAFGARPRLESELFALWAIVALTELTPRALDPLHYALSRVPAPRSELLDALAALVRAALDLGSDPARALASVTLLPSFGDVDLDRRAHGVRLAAARRFAGGYAQHLAALEPWVFGRADEADAARCRAVREHDVLPELEPVVADRLRLARAAQHGWLGWLRYREGRFEDAAAHHELAAAGEPWLGPRLGAMLNAASAHMEAFHYARADELARAVLADAARARQMSLEARAEWLLRLIAYRRGDPVQPDLELVAAIEALGGGDIEAQTLLTEAIVAWRVGAHDLGRRLAERPRRHWVSTRWEVGALLAACIHVACGGEVTDDEARELVGKSVRCSQPLIGLQTLALIARRAPGEVAACGDAPAALAASLPVERWGARLDVMSAREALASITDATRP